MPTPQRTRGPNPKAPKAPQGGGKIPTRILRQSPKRPPVQTIRRNPPPHPAQRPLWGGGHTQSPAPFKGHLQRALEQGAVVSKHAPQGVCRTVNANQRGEGGGGVSPVPRPSADGPPGRADTRRAPSMAPRTTLALPASHAQTTHTYHSTRHSPSTDDAHTHATQGAA